MNRFVISLSLFLVFFAICVVNCVEFCDLQSFDSVFNIGPLIYMIRCGELWAYDQRRNKGNGAFFKEYAVWGFARNHFEEHIMKNNANKVDYLYHNKWLRFSAFSFQNLECEDWYVDLERDCLFSVQEWNHLTAVGDHRKLVTFRYSTDIDFRNDSINPLGFPGVQDIWNKSSMAKFWPDITQLLPEYGWTQWARFQSGLFFREPFFNDYRLFLGFLSEDEKFYCVTHINIKDMLFDSRKWPIRSDRKTVYQWAPPYCFTGRLVGMFTKDGKAYIVGRILYSNRVHEDQVYEMTASDKSQIEVSPMNVPGFDYPHNLRTFFGCDVEERYRATTTTTLPPPVNSTMSTTRPQSRERREPPGTVPDRLVPGVRKENRKKRSVEEQQTMVGFISNDICRELRDDWSLLLFISFIDLIMLFIVLRLKKN